MKNDPRRSHIHFRRWLAAAVLAMALIGAGAVLKPNVVRASSPLVFMPEIPIPGVFSSATKVDNTLAGKYINGLYVYFVWGIGLLGVTMVVFGGIRWIVAAGNSSRINEAKETIQNAIIGIIIALTSFVLLSLINPGLINVGIPQLTNITGQEFTSTQARSVCEASLSVGCGQTHDMGRKMKVNNQGQPDENGTKQIEEYCMGTKCSTNGDQVCSLQKNGAMYQTADGCTNAVQLSPTDPNPALSRAPVGDNLLNNLKVAAAMDVIAVDPHNAQHAVADSLTNFVFAPTMALFAGLYTKSIQVGLGAGVATSFATTTGTRGLISIFSGSLPCGMISQSGGKLLLSNICDDAANNTAAYCYVAPPAGEKPELYFNTLDNLSKSRLKMTYAQCPGTAPKGQCNTSTTCPSGYERTDPQYCSSGNFGFISGPYNHLPKDMDICGANPSFKLCCWDTATKKQCTDVDPTNQKKVSDQCNPNAQATAPTTTTNTTNCCSGLGVCYDPIGVTPICLQPPTGMTWYQHTFQFAGCQDVAKYISTDISCGVTTRGSAVDPLIPASEVVWGIGSCPPDTDGNPQWCESIGLYMDNTSQCHFISPHCRK